jgi:hypothetical protein
MVQEAGIELRLHSWFSHTLVEDGRVTGVVCESKSGPQAILGQVVIDTTGDLDVAASAGAPHTGGNYIMTTVFRLGGVDTDTAERFEREEPEEYAALDRRSRRCWAAPGACGGSRRRCPASSGATARTWPGWTARRSRTSPVPRSRAAATSMRWSTWCARNCPASRSCYVVDVAPQTGVRQTRLLEGEYILTKEDLTQRTRFADSVARGATTTCPTACCCRRRSTTCWWPGATIR